MTPLLLVAPLGPSFVALKEKLTKESSPSLPLQVVECPSSLEAVSIARKVGTCLILCFAGESDDIVKHITMLKLLSQAIARKQVRVVLTTVFRQPAIHSKLNLHGCSEILIEPTTPKSMIFKLERHYRALPRKKTVESPKAESPKKTETVIRTEEKQVVKPEAPAVSRAPSRARGIRIAEPLDLESDCWIISGGGAKKIASRWLIRLKGPGSEFGQWVRQESEDPIDFLWRWEPDDLENDPFIKEQGNWVFHGQRPEFQEGTWSFIGKHPELSFYYEGHSYGSKFILDESGELVIAKNSAAAKKALELIKKTNQEAKAAKTDRMEKKVSEASKKEMNENDSKKADFTMGEPLRLESDCWLLLKNKPRKVSRRYAVKLVGPGPLAGRWIEVESGDNPLWKWIPNDPDKDPFIKEEGAWMYRGFAPKFQDDGWLFVGYGLELAFYYEGQSCGAKLSLNQAGVLVIAQDSNAAISALPSIRTSYEKVIRQETDKEDEDLSQFVVKSDEKVDAEGSEEELFQASSSDGDAKSRFEYPLSHFGEGEGKWIYICPSMESSRNMKIYVYVPAAWMKNFVGDIREIGVYWVFEGEDKPRRSSTSWIFEGREPALVTDFKDLAKPIQSYLLGFNPEATAIQEAESTESRVYEGEIKADEEGHIYEGEIEAEKEGAVYSGEIKADDPRAPDWNTNITEEEVEQYFNSEGSDGSADVSSSAAKKLFEKISKINSTSATPLTGHAPAVRPIALAFLSSEIMMKKEKTLKQIGDRYCAYLSAACGGEIQVELWANREGEWLCAGASDESSGKLSPKGAGHLLAQIESGGRVLGSLVIGGEDLSQIPLDYVEAAAAMIRGLMISVCESGMSDVKTAA